nr:hypothetical protein [Tanacetum cinerariifolium]
DERAHRRDVANTQPDATHEAVAEIEQSEAMHVHAIRANQEAAAEAQRRRQHGFTRPYALEPFTKNGGRQT